MSTVPLFPSFDGLLNLSKHEGVDIRPTLLRVLTDLYVQAPAHTDDEKRQFTELVTRLIDVVDEATHASVRAKLLVCVDTPPAVAAKFGFRPSTSDESTVVARSEPRIGAPEDRTNAPNEQMRPRLTMRPDDAAEIDRMFSAANASERIQILHNLELSSLSPAARPGPRRAERAIETLEMAAFASDAESFAIELSDILLLPSRAASRVVEASGGEALACACKALGMPAEVFQRVLLFLNPAIGTSVLEVFRAARLYDVLTERAALIMVSVWRGSTMAQTRARYRPALYDDERRPARLTPLLQPQRPGSVTPSQPATNRSKSHT